MGRWIKLFVVLVALLVTSFSPYAQVGTAVADDSTPTYEGCEGYVTGLYWINIDTYREHVAMISKDIKGKEKLRCVRLSDPLDETKKYTEAKDMLIAAYTTSTKVAVLGFMLEGQTYMDVKILEPVAVSIPANMLQTFPPTDIAPNELVNLAQNSYNLLKTMSKKHNPKR